MLKRAERFGLICDLRLQQNFTLIEGFTKPDGERVRAVVYKADFTYRVAKSRTHPAAVFNATDMKYWAGMEQGALVIEDVKSVGTRTRVYINKKKMMAQKGYTIREV